MTTGSDHARRSAFRILPWLLGSLTVLLMGWQDAQRLDGLVIAHSAVWGRDFLNMWTGGRIVAAHRLDILYDLKPYAAFQNGLFGPIRQHNYSYPPPSLFLCAPLGWLPYVLALAIWLVAGGAALVAVLRRRAGVKPGLAVAAAVFTPAATINIWSGQYGFLTGALFLAAALEAKAAPRRAGLFAALLTVKPHLGVLLPLLFVWQRRWAAIGWSALFVLLLVGASGWTFGWGLWRAYLTQVPAIQAGLFDHRSDFFITMMPTMFVATRILQIPAAIGWAIQGAAATLAVLCCRRVARADPDGASAAFVAATATFLVIPYGFDYDMVASGAGVAIMLERHWPRLSTGDRAVLIAGLMSPQLVILAGFAHAPIGPLLVAATLLTQTKIATAMPPASRRAGHHRREDRSDGGSPADQRRSGPWPIGIPFASTVRGSALRIARR